MKVRLDNLNRVYTYCLNNVDCRRTLLLEYFGEQYLSSQCKRRRETRCDNCCSVAQTKSVDFTNLSKEIRVLVENITKKSRSVTINQLVDILKGSKQKFIKDSGYDQFDQFNKAADVQRIGSNKALRLVKYPRLPCLDLERLLSKLVLEGYLHQDISINDTYGTANAYIRPGPTINFSTPIILSICAKKENSNSTTTSQKIDSHKTRLIDECLLKLKEELKSIGNEHNIKYSTILSEKSLKQMSCLMPKNREEMIEQIVEVTSIKYEMYTFERLLKITNRFRSAVEQQQNQDLNNSNLKRKREINESTKSAYFNQENEATSKKKK